MSIFDIEIGALTDGSANLANCRGKALLIVNVASRCGLTAQYTELQALQDAYGDRGLTVVAVPCNQFAGQEPGGSAEIEQCARGTYHATFPITEKVDVNGPGRHPLYQALVDVPDIDGYTGDIRWNFEKFVIAPDGAVAARFSPQVTPQSPEVVAVIEKVLPA
ncbi:MAG TPA: glutathione peroxidase [Micromonospora sp.]